MTQETGRRFAGGRDGTLITLKDGSALIFPISGLPKGTLMPGVFLDRITGYTGSDAALRRCGTPHTSPRSGHLIHIPDPAQEAWDTFAARIPSGHAKRQFDQVGPAHRQWTHPGYHFVVPGQTASLRLRKAFGEFQVYHIGPFILQPDRSCRRIIASSPSCLSVAGR